MLNGLAEELQTTANADTARDHLMHSLNKLVVIDAIKCAIASSTASELTFADSDFIAEHNIPSMLPRAKAVTTTQSTSK